MVPQKILLYLRFLGTNYCGWQVQPNGVSVQRRVQDAIEAVCGAREPLTGCSRTDAGVHANMFCCAFPTTANLPPERWIAALNAHLPADIAVFDCRAVPEDFHPRYSAAGKRYCYRIWNGSARSPFWEGRAHWVRGPLPEEQMNIAAAHFRGTHDFSAFTAAHSAVEDKIRTITDSRVFRRGDVITFSVTGSGFLYNMVRIMTGTLLDVAAGRIQPEDIPKIIAGRNRNNAGPTAPAQGLYLEEVYY